MKNFNLIHQIDNRINTGEFDDFKSIKNRLIKIRGKLLHKTMLSKSDIETLKNEDFLIS